MDSGRIATRAIQVIRDVSVTMALPLALPTAALHLACAPAELPIAYANDRGLAARRCASVHRKRRCADTVATLPASSNAGGV
jgi:hypothetical protein